jgi:hypothetical protein
MGETISSIKSSTSAKYLVNSSPNFIDKIPEDLPRKDLNLFRNTLSKLPHEYIICSMEHPWTLSCHSGAITYFSREWLQALNLYAPLNLFMAAIFQRKKLVKHPVQMLSYLAKSTLRSTLFLSSYVTFAWYIPCLLRNLFGKDEPWMYFGI